jgi:predicted lipoprotein with Yx(FWY)xxD motif
MIRSRSLSALVAAPAAVALTALAVAACGGGGSTATATSVTAPKTASGHRATIGVASVGGLGKILVDSKGRTLYLFQKDAGNASSCSGACAGAWPPLRASSKPVVGAGAKASLVGTIPRSDGAAQVTYNGHPVYRFGGDHAPGDSNGQGVNAFGARWFALSSSGNVVSSGTGSGSGSGGGNGY